jgi:hypothetical protein
MTKNLLLIFTRNPELGKCKTRLAKTIGDQNALTVYTMLLRHTAAATKNLSCDKAVYYSIKVREKDCWDDTIYQKYAQNGADLGIRMSNAFAESFRKGYEKVLIIGSDLYDLSPTHIEQAFEQLDTHDVVIGPALDGGYYLLGMNYLHPKLFQNKEWGTANVRKATLDDLKNHRVYQLELLNDIDTFDDIKDYDVFKPYFIK